MSNRINHNVFFMWCFIRYDSCVWRLSANCQTTQVNMAPCIWLILLRPPPTSDISVLVAPTNQTTSHLCTGGTNQPKHISSLYWWHQPTKPHLISVLVVPTKPHLISVPVAPRNQTTSHLCTGSTNQPNHISSLYWWHQPTKPHLIFVRVAPTNQTTSHLYTGSINQPNYISSLYW